ncbi:MAG: tRNA 2-thiouridine(34) synthase MnmA [Vulcanimicrobiaceae bacterium]
MRVVAAMSGGVDSAVAAGLLVEAGYDVVGVTMKTYSATRAAYAKSCCGADDFDDARRSAAILGIPHYVLDVEAAFQRAVIDRFADAYRGGRTPNPCVDCNVFIKLGTLRQYARRIGAQFVATGHYARVAHAGDGPHLYAGDPQKDQSYALASLSPDQLAMLLTPLGTLDKPRARAEAARLGLPVADKPESQDICFVEGRDYREIVAASAPHEAAAGTIVTTAGAVVGAHAGIAQFTVGQRRGLPAHNENDGPRYVTRIDPQSNTIVIGREDELSSSGLVADGVNQIRAGRFAGGPTNVRAMTRYRAPLARAVAHIDCERGELRLEFKVPERAVAPGQLVALYDEAGEEVLAAATIRAAI